LGILRGAIPIAVALACVDLGWSAAARADETASESRESARALANRGWELFKAGRYDEAIAVLEKADEHFHAPTVLLVLARAHDKAGHLTQAKKVYARIVSEPLAADAPEEFARAKETARAELTAVEARIPRLTLKVAGAAPSSVRVEIDGVDRSQDALPGPLPLNPGTHTVVVSGARGSETRSISLQEGKNTTVDIELVAPTAKGTARTTAGVSAEPTHQRPAWPGIAALAVGAVGLGVGAVTGVMALSKANDVKSRCVAGHCPAEDASKADSARTLGTVSTIGFVVGGVGIGAGTFLLLSRGSDKTVGVVARGSF
jgi:hypothetical protein